MSLQRETEITKRSSSELGIEQRHTSTTVLDSIIVCRAIVEGAGVRVEVGLDALPGGMFNSLQHVVLSADEAEHMAVVLARCAGLARASEGGDR